MISRPSPLDNPHFTTGGGDLPLSLNLRFMINVPRAAAVRDQLSDITDPQSDEPDGMREQQGADKDERGRRGHLRRKRFSNAAPQK